MTLIFNLKFHWHPCVSRNFYYLSKQTVFLWCATNIFVSSFGNLNVHSHVSPAHKFLLCLESTSLYFLPFHTPRILLMLVQLQHFYEAFASCLLVDFSVFSYSTVLTDGFDQNKIKTSILVICYMQGIDSLWHKIQH
jgi:hypothetical protein